MCVILSLIALKSDYIAKADQVYGNLEEFELLFEQEALIIDHMKCLLARNEEIGDFCAGSTCVSVFRDGEAYLLYFSDLFMRVDVCDRQIVGFEVKRQ